MIITTHFCVCLCMWRGAGNEADILWNDCTLVFRGHVCIAMTHHQVMGWESIPYIFWDSPVLPENVTLNCKIWYGRFFLLFLIFSHFEIWLEPERETSFCEYGFPDITYADITWYGNRSIFSIINMSAQVPVDILLF